MKRRVVALLMATMMGAFCITGCGSSKEATSDKAAKTEKEADTESDKDADKKAADKVAALIDAIYVCLLYTSRCVSETVLCVSMPVLLALLQTVGDFL